MRKILLRLALVLLVQRRQGPNPYRLHQRQPLRLAEAHEGNVGQGLRSNVRKERQVCPG